MLAGLLAATGIVLSLWVEQVGIYEAPPIEAAHPAFAHSVVTDPLSAHVRRYGESWLHQDRGVAELLLVGGPVDRGAAMGALCADALREQEDTLVTSLERLLPPGLRRAVVRKFVLFAYRDLQTYVDDDVEIELAALARALADHPPHALEAEFPEFHRALFYQTLYDTGQAMAEAGFVEAELGCTSFVAGGAATASGAQIVGRNCDFEAGPVFDDRKVVFFIVPQSGQRYVHVAWAGMAGVVTGVNESGLVVLLHAARTTSSRWPRVGAPIPLILRDALREDSTIEDVAARLEQSPQHAAAIVVVAETRTGRSAVIETDDQQTVVTMSDTDVLVAANHLRSAVWDGDEVAEAARRVGSSSLRQARMSELLDESLGEIDATRAVAVLRDDGGLGGLDIGHGNRTAIAAMITAHAVVIDASPRELHVGRAPRALGRFVSYDLARFFAGGVPGGPSDVRVTDATPIDSEVRVDTAIDVASGRRLLRVAASARAEGDTARAREAAAQASELLSRSPESLLELCEALMLCGDASGARELAETALGRQPVPGVERERLLTLAGR